MKYPKLREIKKALSALFSKAYTTSFPFRPHIPFLSFRGKPYFYEKDCIGCGACVNVCPTGALSMLDIKDKNGYKRILKIRWDICIECGQCQLNCLTEKGIILSNEFDISTTEKRELLYQSIEKKLVTCEVCHQPIAPYDQIIWTIKKLGPLYTSNTSLIAFTQEHIKLREVFSFTAEEIGREDRFRILCSYCRRKAVVTS